MTLTPGADTFGLTLPVGDGPRLEKNPIWSLISVAPRLMTSLKLPGVPAVPQPNSPALPAANTGMIPAARQAWTDAR